METAPAVSRLLAIMEAMAARTDEAPVAPTGTAAKKRPRAAATRRRETRSILVPAPLQPAAQIGKRTRAVMDLLAWVFGSLALMWFLGGWIFVSAFCGFDWDAPCEKRYVAGWGVIALTIAAILGLAFLTRRRSVVVIALASTPALVWYYAAWAVPTASSIPNLPG